MKLLENRKFKDVLAYLCIFVMAVIMAFMYQLFVIKNSFAPAGLNGIATMVQYKTGFSIGYMSLLINTPLCLWAYFYVDRRFAVRSFFFSLVYSVVYLLLGQLDLSAFQYDAKGHDTIFPAILSGVIGGMVYGICFKNSASTGGTDIVSKYISKVYPNLNFFYVTFAINAVVAATSFFVYTSVGENGAPVYDYKPVCLCVLYCFLSTTIGNSIISGQKRAYKFTIITTHPDEITQEIFQVIRHGATRVGVIGTYNNKERTMLICVINPHQMVDLKNIIARYDDTFSYSETVNETYGNFVKVRKGQKNSLE